MHEVAGELGEEVQLLLLMGGTGWRNPDQRLHERLVVSKQGGICTIKEEPEVPHRVGSQELSVKGEVTILGGGKLLGEEGKGSPGTLNKLLENSCHVRV